MDRTTDQSHVVELHKAAVAALATGRDSPARATFAEAERLASEVLPPTDPVRLALAGAHGEAWFERWNDAEKALEIAQGAYDDAVLAIDDAPGGQYRDTVRQLSVLRDQMTFWAFRMSSS